MNPSAIYTCLRVIVQLALSGGVIVFFPVVFVLCAKMPQAFFERDYREMFLSFLPLLGIWGIAALCVSIVLPPEYLSEGRKRRTIVIGGLAAGLFVATVLLVRFIDQSMKLPDDWLALYLTVGPSIVAIWNLMRLNRRANKTPLPTPGECPPSNHGPVPGAADL